MEYTVKRIDGGYTYLEKAGASDEELKCVVRVLLPSEISEGSMLVYEMLEYSLK